jgi:hypothetical protein
MPVRATITAAQRLPDSHWRVSVAFAAGTATFEAVLVREPRVGGICWLEPPRIVEGGVRRLGEILEGVMEGRTT